MNRQTCSTRPIRHRGGFTLVELLVVIVIIAILMALIIPAIQGVRRRAQVAEISSEISKLDTAITQFASDFGVEPCSELVLTEDTSVTAWDANPSLVLSRTRIRRMFPQFTFTGQIDFNADGQFTGDAGSDATITLSSSECLVFFLAGVMSRDKDGNGAVDPAEVTEIPTWIGFSKNPVNPFLMAGSNRLGPYFTFDVSRLKDSDTDGMPEFVDSIAGQETPYYFASANSGQGYASFLSYYVQSDGKTPWNKDSHQIISPGFDGQLGFDPMAGLKGPYSPDTKLTGTRTPEADNIANFKPGTTLDN